MKQLDRRFLNQRSYASVRGWVLAKLGPPSIVTRWSIGVRWSICFGRRHERARARDAKEKSSGVAGGAGRGGARRGVACASASCEAGRVRALRVTTRLVLFEAI